MKNFAIDCMDRFDAAATPIERWQEANRIITEIGGTSLNVCTITTKTATPNWFQSTMSEDWMSRYLEKAYHNADPFVRGISAYAEKTEVYLEQPEQENTRSDLELDLLRDMKDIGYNYGLCLGFGGGSPNLRKAVAVITSDTARTLGAEFQNQVRLASVMIAAYVDPLDPNHHDYYLPDREIISLSARERQVLEALARGLQNKQIAHDLDIAEITVRKHLQSVRLKLGARSREEAIAVAARTGQLSM